MATKGKELYKRPDSAAWWYRFSNPRTGTQERGSTKTSDRQIAQRFIDEIKARAWIEAVNYKSLAQDEPKLWIEATTKWIETKGSKRSLHTDIERINIIAPALNEISLKTIDDDLIRKKIVLGICKQRRMKPATVNRYIDLIRSILKASEGWNWLEKVPKLGKPGKEGERQRKAWLTPNQFNRAYDAMSPLKAKMMMLALCTGMRADNIITLHPSEVDLVNKTIFIPAKKFKGKRDHTIPLNKTAIQILASELGKSDDAVFTHFGNPIKRFSLKGWHEVFDSTGINDELRKAGLLTKKNNDADGFTERFVFHGMRHTFATWLARSGVPIEIIETIGGWSRGSKKMVNIYTHIDDVSHLLPYVRNIDLILSGKKKV